MSFDRSRRGSDPRQAAEAAFRAVTRKVPEGSGPEGKAADGKATDGKPKPAAKAAVPGVRETVSLRLDRDVLDHFQEDGPGWQDASTPPCARPRVSDVRQLSLAASLLLLAVPAQAQGGLVTNPFASNYPSCRSANGSPRRVSAQELTEGPRPVRGLHLSGHRQGRGIDHREGVRFPVRHVDRLAVRAGLDALGYSPTSRRGPGARVAVSKVLTVPPYWSVTKARPWASATA